MHLGLEDRAAIVTGASRGIGYATAESLLREGCSVAICALDEDRLADARDELAEHGDVLAVRADVTDEDEVATLVEATVDEFGGVDVLVNNAGIIGSESPFHEIPVEEWEAVFDVNLLGMVRVTRAVLPHMREQEAGRIVNVASEAGSQPDDYKPHYDASNAAVINFTKNLSKTYSPEGIRVNAVSPATTLTPLVEELFAERAAETGQSEAEVRREFVETEKPGMVRGLGRLGRPEEIASVVTFLASDQASYVTGANYRVDGGSIYTMDS